MGVIAGVFYMSSFGISGETLASELEGARRVIESHFLSAGESLTQSMNGIDTLIASLENLVKALDDKAVAASTADMRVAADTLLGLADNHRVRKDAMARLGRHRDDLAKHVGDMHASLAYMRAFTVNIKIVSAGIAQAGSTFESFAQEISDCIESGRIQLQDVEGEIVGLNGGLAAASAESARLGSQLSTLLPALPNQLSDSAGLMAQHYGQVHEIAGEVATIARNIHKRVVRVLQALQIGDMTRQRVEHVQSGLKKIAARGDRRLTALGHALLERQLQATKEEFDREVGEIEKAMADMAAHSRELLKLRDMAYGCCSQKGAGFLDELLKRIEDASVLVGEIEGADSSALKTGRETAAAAEQLCTRISAIQSLKNDVQYMALNTTIKCAQIGEAARPLSVIAIELRDHGRHLEEAAAAGLAELDELTSAAGALTTVRDRASGLGATEALGIASRLLQEGRQRAANEIDVLVSKGEEVLSILDQSVERLAFKAEIGGTLGEVADELSSLAASSPDDARELRAQLTEILSSIHALYTMKQERAVHQDFVAWLGLDLSAPEVHAPAAAVA